MPRNIKVGVAGWSYADWSGTVYPAGLKGVRRLEYLARFFDLVEINTSFYGSVKPETARSWCSAIAGVNPRFVFTAKLYRGFTHSPVATMESTSAKTIRATPQDVREARAGFDAIAGEGRLGAVLAQFPISFQCTDGNRAHIEKIAREFQSYPLVFEIRHASWNQPEILQWLARLGVGICNIDQPLLGRAIRPAAHATSPVGYIRLHGRNYAQWFAVSANARDRYDYLYSRTELEGWKERAEEVAENAETTFVVTNNHNVGKAAVNALDLLHLLNGTKVDAPPPLVAAYPHLRDFARE